MNKLYLNCGDYFCMQAVRLQNGFDRLLREEKGDLVSSLGWMAIIALILVMVKGIVDGKLSGYVNNIFSHLDRVFSSGA